MSKYDPPLRHDRRAGDHRKGDHRLGAQPVRVQGRRDATKPQIKAAVEKLFDVKVKASTRCPQGQEQGFRGVRGQQQDVKKAIVTLADGQRST